MPKPALPPAKPVVKVYLLPSTWMEQDYEDYFRALVRAAASVGSLHVRNEKDMIVLFPKDAMVYGAGTEIVMEVAVPGNLELTEGQKDEALSALRYVTQLRVRGAYVQCTLNEFSVGVGYDVTARDGYPDD